MAQIALGFVGWWVGMLAGGVYGIGRFLGSPSFQDWVLRTGHRWNIRGDLSGDGAFTITDLVLWAGWILYLPGDALMAVGNDTPATRSFFEITPASFGGTASLVLSLIVWFGISYTLIALSRNEPPRAGESGSE